MSNIGKWNKIYESRPYNWPYGPQITYLLALDFLSTCKSVQDWGCGANWFKTLAKSLNTYPHMKITGVDGSGKQCDRIEDLTKFNPDPKPEGILLRHVLEHNYDWEKILRNALSSATKKIAIVLFTPFSETIQKAEPDYIFENGDTCPNLSFPKESLLGIVTDAGFTVATQTINQENLFLATKLTPLQELHEFYAEQIDLQRQRQDN